MNPIAKMLLDMAKFYDQQIDQRQLEMYVEILQKAPVEVVLQAGKEYIADTANVRFPIPPHKILDKFIKPPASKDVAREDAMRIVQAVSKFGYMRGQDAKTFVGERGWVAVERWGGWGYVCSSLGVNIEINAFVAQTRDMLESQATLQNQGHDISQPVQISGTGFTTMIQSSKKGLESTSDILQKLINKGETNGSRN